MKIVPFVLLAFLFTVSTTPSWAVDYKVDDQFSPPQFGLYDTVQDVLVLPDAKLIVGGSACPGFTGNCAPFLKRLNADGTVDASFISAISPAASGHSYVRSIRSLANGQILITGDFNVGAVRANYARLNADGSLDPTMLPAYLNGDYGSQVIEPTSDGKYIVCTNRTINSEDYKLAHRINSDGSPDPTFRVTFMVGFCEGLKVLANGKILITVGTQTGQTQVKPLHRLHPDGSKDMTFDADLPVGSYADGLSELPDGKLLVTSSMQGQSSSHVRRLLPDGALQGTIPLCAFGVFFPQKNGEMITSGCRRWSGYFGNRLQFARVLADDSVDPTLDNIYFDGGLSGAREAGDSEFYYFGDFRSVQSDTTKMKLVRLEPNLAPLKAKFDFDNDGRSDLAVFRPSDGTWYIYQSSDGPSYTYWGFPDDQLAAGHFDNDGKTDIGIYRNGIIHAYSPVFGHRQLYLGLAGDKPMFGNFEDRGLDIEDFATRGLREGVVKWFIRHGDTVANPFGSWSTLTLPNELITDKPVVGDFNGDSRDEFGYFRDGVWYTVDRYNYAPPASVQWGIAGDIPVPGDYDGDRQTDYAVFRPSTGDWWIRLSSGGYFILTFGQNGDIPVPADYDGDGKVDVAIFRDGNWWQYRSATGNVHVDQWGVAGDKPIPAQHQ